MRSTKELRELRRLVWGRVENRLQAELRFDFASKREVLILIRRRLRHRNLSVGDLADLLASLPQDGRGREAGIEAEVDRICAPVSGAPYIRDCEEVARYLRPGMSREERERIWGHYWMEHDLFAKRVVLARLGKRFGWPEARNRLGKVRSRVDEMVFARERFRSIAKKYRPWRGKTFSEWFRQAITYAARDVLKKENPPPPVQPLGGRTLPVRPPRGGGGGAYRALLDCLERLEASRGNELRAVFELRHRVYLDPEDFSPETRERFGEDPEFWLRMDDEYQRARQAWVRLRDEELPGAEYDLGRARRNREVREEDLSREGYTAPEIDELSVLDFRRKITAMEKKVLSHKGNPAKRSRVLELEFMIALERERTARMVLESLRAQESACNRAARQPAARKGGRVEAGEHWVRTEKRVGEFVGLSQATITRRLEEAKGFVLDCMGPV